MLNGFANVTSKIDKMGDLKDILNNLANKDVLVGIPQEDSSRGDVIHNRQLKNKKKVGSISRGEDTINNAELLYMLSHGVRQTQMIKEMQEEVEQSSYSHAYEMYVHEHGSPLWHSPPRPVLEPAIENSKELIAEQLKKAMQVALDGKDPLSQLQKAGMLGQNAARDWFTNPKNGWEPNSPLTIKLKGSSNPLIDTGEMRKAITYVVKEK